MNEIRLTTRLGPAETILGLQSAVAAFAGLLSSVSDTVVAIGLDPYAKTEILKQLYKEPEDAATYRHAVKINAHIVSGSHTTAILTTPPSTWYMLDALGITASTLDAFARTVASTYSAMENKQRPPDRPPPPR